MRTFQLTDRETSWSTRCRERLRPVFKYRWWPQWFATGLNSLYALIIALHLLPTIGNEYTLSPSVRAGMIVGAVLGIPVVWVCIGACHQYASASATEARTSSN